MTNSQIFNRLADIDPEFDEMIGGFRFNEQAKSMSDEEREVINEEIRKKFNVEKNLKGETL